FPQLKLCFAHGAGALPYTIGRISHGYNVRPDLCATNCPNNPTKYLNQLYADSLVHDEHALKLLVNVLGEDNVLLGSDYPFPLGEQHPGKLIESIESYNFNLKEKLLIKNGLKFLNLDQEKFEQPSKINQSNLITEVAENSAEMANQRMMEIETIT
ncbi:amidohydrolase family protein, partial [Salmonella sp. s51228]|uniref:amidohydrolase family protein n=1 Tax=Salmonella sp. s51228 TaxID=3159652 RepID=UPI0039802433